jgi:hypothetical protein
MRLFTLFSLCVAVPALAGKPATTAKIFTDKGSTYFRTDNKKALSVGLELDVVADAKDTSKPVGQAVVMEVNGALARISVDEDATKAGGKFVVLPTGASAAKAPAKEDEADDDDAPKTPAFKGTGNKLDGKLGIAGLHFSWSNNSDTSWTQCRLVHSDGSFFDVGEVVKHTDDGVLRVKLGGAPEPAFDHVEVLLRPAEPAEGLAQGLRAQRRRRRHPLQPDGHRVDRVRRAQARRHALRAGHAQGPRRRQHREGPLQEGRRQQAPVDRDALQGRRAPHRDLGTEIRPQNGEKSSHGGVQVGLQRIPSRSRDFSSAHVGEVRSISLFRPVGMVTTGCRWKGSNNTDPDFTGGRASSRRAS